MHLHENDDEMERIKQLEDVDNLIFVVGLEILEPFCEKTHNVRILEGSKFEEHLRLDSLASTDTC